MAAEEPLFNRPVDPDDVGKFPMFDGTDIVWDTPAGGGGGSMTASQILTALKTVDGTGSGLDADLLDGQHAAAFLTRLWTQADAAGQAVELGDGVRAVAIWAEAGGPSIGSKDDSRLLIEAQARWDSDDDGVEGTGIDINKPAIVLRQTGEDHKGAMLEMQQYLAAGTHTYGSATNAAGGTFNVGAAGYKRVGWILAHYDSPNPADGIHQHMNFETVQADLSTIVTRFQISWGEDIALASFPNSHVRFYDDKEVQLGSDRDVVLKFDTAQSRVVVTGATWRFGTGSSSVWIDVTNGRLGVGPAVSAPSAPLHLERADDGQSILARNTAVGGNTGAVIKAETQTAASRVMQAGIQSTDTTARWSLETSGKMEWGPGGAGARDTNLYRSAADTLKTDDNLVVGGTLTIGADTVQEVIRDTMGTALVAGSNVTITPNDGADTITIAASATADTGAAPNALTGSPTLLAWYKADALALSDGDPVATWTDSGPNGYTLSQGTSGSRPVYRATSPFNDQPAVEFDGTDDFIRNSSTGASSQTNLTAVIVGTMFTTASCQFFDMRGTGYFNLVASGATYTAQVGTTPITLGVTTKYNTQGVLFVIRSNGTKAQLFVNGVIYAYAETGSAAMTPGSISLGYNTVSSYLKGYIAEAIFYSAYLSQAQIRQVSRHLANKYGFPLGVITA